MIKWRLCLAAAMPTEMSNFPPTFLSYPCKTPAYALYYYAITIAQFEPDMKKGPRSQPINTYKVFTI